MIRRINTTISLIIISVVLAAFALLSWRIISYIEVYVIQKTDSQLQNHLQIVAMQLQARQREIANIATIIATEPAIKRTLHQENNRGVSQTLNRLTSIYPFFNYLLLIDNYHEVFSNSTRDNMGNRLNTESLLGAKIEQMPEIKALLSNTANSKLSSQGGNLKVYPVNNSNNQLFAAPIRYRDQVIGWIVISYAWQHQANRLLTELTQSLRLAGNPITGIWIEQNQTLIAGKQDKSNSFKQFYKQQHLILGDTETTINISLDATTVTQFNRDTQRWITFYSLSSAVLVFLILYGWIKYYVTRRIKLLEKSIMVINRGDLSHRTPELGNDEISHLAVLFNDMTQSLEDLYEGLDEKVKLRTKELEVAIEDLQQSNKELEDFAYVASHDLKEPLRGIANYVSFLIEDYESVFDEDGKRYLERMRLLAKRLAQLIDNLLHFSRIGRTELNLGWHDLQTLTEDVIDIVQEFLDKQQVTVVYEQTLPSLYCDELRMREIMQNLITNAAKYNENELKKITIGWHKNNNIKTIWVKDDGIGIDDKHRQLIFRIFKRLHEEDRFGGGNGAGLTIVKKLINRHGGNLWLESEVGKGSTFYFSLPEAGLNKDSG